MDRVKEMEVMDEKLKEKGLKRVQVDGDGWCMVHAWIRAMEAEGLQHKNAADMVREACVELLDHPDDYELLTETNTYKHDILKYAMDKNFDSPIVDSLGYALSHISKVRCIVHKIEDQVHYEHELKPAEFQNERNENWPEIHIVHLTHGNNAPHYDAVIRSKYLIFPGIV